MKRGQSLPQLKNHRRWELRVECWVFSLTVAVLLAANAEASTSGINPYSGIIVRNSFGLKPPSNPADFIKPPPVVVADIKLQGITTILGRNQVLMKIKVPAKPPEPVREQSVVLSEGQREGEVEVLEINPSRGTVKLNNGPTLLMLNMEDHGEKPTPGAAAPVMLGAPGAGAAPSVPPPPMVPTAALPTAPAAALETFGGNKTIPTRTLRAGDDRAGIGAGNSGQSPLGAETAAALYIVNQAKNEQLRQSGVPIPRMPQHPFMKGIPGAPGSTGE